MIADRRSRLGAKIRRRGPVLAACLSAAALLGTAGIAAWNGTATAAADPEMAPTDVGVEGPETEGSGVAPETATPEPGPSTVFPVARHDLNSVIGWFGDPRDGGRRRHMGIDIAAPVGTPVLAPVAGVVDRIDHGGAGGLAVWLRDGTADRSYYFAHLDAIGVYRGQRVRAGGLIGTVGRTGNAATTPPHLHFAVHQGRQILDPWSFLATRGSGVPAVAGAGEARAPVLWTRLDGAALRSAPGGGTTIAVLPRLQPVTVLGRTGRSVFVRFRHHEGYIADWLLEEGE
jgi:peptidoglycan LD-endopeptidase LytH